MQKCNICGRSNQAFMVCDEKVKICDECSFQVSTSQQQGIVECIELMQDIFKNCPQPQELSRVFSFFANHVSKLFEAIAHQSVARNIWRIITGVYVDEQYPIGSETFYEHPEHLERIKESILGDYYLYKVFSDKEFKFLGSISIEEGVDPLASTDASSLGIRNISDMFVTMQYDESFNDSDN